MVTPIFLSFSSEAAADSMSFMATFSVTSSSASAGLIPDSTSALSRIFSKPALASCTDDRFTAMVSSGKPASCHTLPERRVQHPFADRSDQAGFFRNRNEILRADVAHAGPLPPEQGFHANDTIAGDIDLGLVD